jgi:signal recognition particle receptor subunit beta
LLVCCASTLVLLTIAQVCEQAAETNDTHAHRYFSEHDSDMGGCCCHPFSGRNIIVLGTAQAGTTSLVRRMVFSTQTEQRNAPLPSTGVEGSWPAFKHDKETFRVVDAGPVGAPGDPPSKALLQAMDRCDGVVLVLDATRSLEEQHARFVYDTMAGAVPSDTPCLVLANKCDLQLSQLTPAVVASGLELPLRRGVWLCQPAAATHRLYMPRSVLAFFTDPAAYSAAPPIAEPSATTSDAHSHAGSTPEFEPLALAVVPESPGRPEEVLANSTSNAETSYVAYVQGTVTEGAPHTSPSILSPVPGVRHGGGVEETAPLTADSGSPSALLKPPPPHRRSASDDARRAPHSAPISSSARKYHALNTL